MFDLRAGRNRNGPWHLLVEKDGTYEIALRRWPKEANAAIAAGVPAFKAVDGGLPTGEALPIAKARLKIAGLDETKPVGPGDKEVVFVVIAEGRHPAADAIVVLRRRRQGIVRGVLRLRPPEVAAGVRRIQLGLALESVISGWCIGRGFQCCADQGAQAAVVNSGRRLLQSCPFALPPVSFGPAIGNLGDVQKKNRYMIRFAELAVDIASDRLVREHTEQACLFPRFLERRFAGGLAGFDASLGYHPSLAAGGEYQADAAGTNRDGRGLAESLPSGCHDIAGPSGKRA